jgi:hypothetical protein
MKRLAVALLTLVTCIGITLGNPSRLGAMHPPCPDQMTFYICVDSCPVWLDQFCFNLAGRPDNCVVVSDDCMDTWACGDPASPQVTCTYSSY